jgi:Na+/H+ antiporter NhaD/arsenite permease-like protein
VGGTLTHFAAPPVLMVAGTWGWGFSHMLLHFGWKAVIGILFANTLYYFYFPRRVPAWPNRPGRCLRMGCPSEIEVEEEHAAGGMR